VQTLQRPGEIIFVPSNAPFAFYNVDKTTVDIKTSFLGVGDVEMMSSVAELSTYYDDVLDRVVGDDDRQRMKGAKKQVLETKKDLGGTIVAESLI
jgi:hypothetical protein